MTFGTLIVAFGIMSLTIPYRLPDSGVSGSPYSPTTLSAYLGLGGGSGQHHPSCLGDEVTIGTFRRVDRYAVTLLTAFSNCSKVYPNPHLDELLLVAILAGAVKGLGGGLDSAFGKLPGRHGHMVVAPGSVTA